MLRIGVDLGGSKIEAVALAADGGIVKRLRVATPRGDYRATVAAVCDLVRQVGAGDTAIAVGLGIPGYESLHDGRIRNANSICLNGQALRVDLEAGLGCPVREAAWLWPAKA